MDAVFVDVGGVLLVPHPAAISQALAAAGLAVDLDPELALRAHYLGVRALDETADGQAYLATVVDVLGVPGHAQPALAALWRGPAIDLWRLPVPGSLDGLRRLAELGYKLAIISNSDGSVEAQLLEHQICQIGQGAGVPVLAIVDSGVVGLSKPDPRIFHLAAERLGVAPERATYVGDSRRYDVTGARAAGLLPVHFDPFEVCPDQHGHAHVHDLGEVRHLL